jgi:hypothetical protein
MAAEHQLYRLYKSTNKLKKWDVWVVNPGTGKTKKVSFGGAGYQDYTQHKDKDRREKYRTRHAKDRIDDITAPGAWSWWVLWGDTTDIDRALKTFLKMHGL